jgi:hypothetical protein
LNEKTVKDAYPLTQIDENLDTLEGADWFTSLDLDMAYHQVPMMDEDKEKTAFATPRGGLYQFTTMPFGLCNAVSTFGRIIEKTLAGLQWQIAVLYLDDIVVFGKSFEAPRWFPNRFIIQELNPMGSHICPANLARSGKPPLIRT